MQPETLEIVSLLMAVWGAALTVKAIHALRTKQPYTFSLWDGGMIRKGKTLTKFGAELKVVVGVLMAGGGIALVSHATPIQPTAYFIIFVCLMSLVSDFVNAG